MARGAGIISRLKTAQSPSSLPASVVVESIRLIEETGPLDDDEAMRAAATYPSDSGSDARITHRARILGKRLGLEADLGHARSWAPWIGIAIVALIVVAGMALAGGITDGTDRRINVMAALLSLLGFHALTMVLWLAGLVLPRQLQRVPRISLGWLWLALTARVAGGRHGQMPVLLRAATRLLSQARLIPWAFGLASHAVWTLSFAVVLAAVVFALAFRSYTLGWETTILDPQFFVRMVQGLGHLPALIGFPVPDPATILMPVTSTASVAQAAGMPDMQRTWALWLTGCILVYGLLPRAIALLACVVAWKLRSGQLVPDLSAPYYRRLQSRFDAMAPSKVVDADAAIPETDFVAPADGTARPHGDAWIVAGFELPPGHPWPPAGLTETARQHAPSAEIVSMDIDGGARSRRDLLDTAARLRPARLLLACRAAASPDRGTERLLRELLGHCGNCTLWLVADENATDDGASRARWKRWIADTGLERIAVHDELSAAMAGPDA